MESYIIKSLNRLKKELPRRCKDIRSHCEDVLVALEGGDIIDEQSIEQISGVLSPFVLSTQSRIPRVMEIALDAINFMIEHGYFNSKCKHTNSSDEALSLIDQVVEIVSKCSDEFDEGVQLQVIKALLTSITSLQCEVHGASLLLAVRSCFHIHLMTKNPSIKTTAKAALTQMVNVVNQRMEVNDSGVVKLVENAEPFQSDAICDELQDENSHISVNPENFVSVYQKDAYLLFRALCKLSMKGSNDDVAGYNDNILLQNKILSLELILNLLQNCGNTFRTTEKFISAVRSYLCVSLLTNCTSHVAQVTGLSLQIFVSLIQNFKVHLKSELEVFVSTIFFRILESENSTFDHKMRVLEVFHDICRDAKDLVELFINYDCDMEAANLFTNIVTAFAKVTKNPCAMTASRITVEFISSSGKKNINEDLHLRSMGVEGLQLIVKSLLSRVGLTVRSTQEELRVDSKRENAFDDDSLENVEDTSIVGEPVVSIVETFDKKLKLQEEIENGILKFNLHPMKGIKYLCSAGHLKLDPKDVAEFLHTYQDKLDKTMIGELLGREREYENGFAYSVLNEYVEWMDFSDLRFDKAIRYFLHGFRLPGEAQKIDRIMEKFAERYYLQHKDEFASADMAFILAFSTIMLQTNLHNPAIRDDKRMTKEQFIKQNKGISTDGELSDELLVEIYDHIAAEPISINQESKKAKKEEPNSSFVVFQSANDKRKKDAFNSERLEMVRAGEAMIRQGKKRVSVFMRSTVAEESYVRPMFELVWPSIIGVVSQMLETTDESKLIELSLSCLQCSIQLSCRLDHSVARKTMIHVLSKFTTLETVREMKQKNVQCIKLLLDIALSEGEYLEESWLLVLQHVSQLARLQLFACGGQTDDMFFSESGNGKKTMRFSVPERSQNGQSDALTKLFMGPSKAEVNRLVEETNSELISREIDSLLLDRIFLSSTNLSAGMVMHFVRSLCEVSMSEISSSSSMNSLKGKDFSFDMSSPRIFSLQKLVEVADYNMTSRSRVDWSNIWKYLADHFTNVGLQDNLALAMYAIDSLKQLSIKFLQKSELSNFNFQRIFLKPFEVIIAKSGNVETKDLVLRCIDIMIRTCAVNIRSGWKSIFNIVEVAANQPSHEIAKFGFDILEVLLGKHFNLLLNDFVELMNSLVVFISSSHTELSLKAFNNLSKCAELLAHGSVVPVNGGGMDSHGDSAVKYTIEEDAAVFRLWWPLLLGLSTHVADVRVPVRCQALDTLSHILFKYGDIFSAQTWSVIFKGVLFPMIDSAKLDSTENGHATSIKVTFKQSWIGTMAKSVLQTCLELYMRFHSNDANAPLLPALLTMLQGCICQENEALAKMGLDGLRQLVLSKQASAITSQLNLVIDRFHRILSSLLVFEFLDVGKISFDTFPCIHLLKSLLFMRKHITADSAVASGLLYEMNNLQDNRIHTIYGWGNLGEYLPVSKNVPARWRVHLDWGGVLFCNQYDTVIFSKRHDESGISDWPTFSSYLTTSLNITFDFLKLYRDFFVYFQQAFTLGQIEIVVNSLEISYWHGVSFNEQLSLRMKLSNLGVAGSPHVTKFPQVIDQEVVGISAIVEGLFSKYVGDKTSIMDRTFVSTNVERTAKMLLDKYIVLEGKQITESGDESDEDQYSKIVDEIASFVEYRRKSYSRVVIMLLDRLLMFSNEQFVEHQHWIVSKLTQLLRCDDVVIRLKISLIFSKFVVPLKLLLIFPLSKPHVSLVKMLKSNLVPVQAVYHRTKRTSDDEFKARFAQASSILVLDAKAPSFPGAVSAPKLVDTSQLSSFDEVKTFIAKPFILYYNHSIAGRTERDEMAVQYPKSPFYRIYNVSIITLRLSSNIMR